MHKRIIFRQGEPRPDKKTFYIKDEHKGDGRANLKSQTIVNAEESQPRRGKRAVTIQAEPEIPEMSNLILPPPLFSIPEEMPDLKIHEVFEQPVEQPKKLKKSYTYDTKAKSTGLSKEDLIIRKFSYDCLLYMLFLIILCIVIFTMTCSSAYYLSRGAYAIFMETPFITDSLMLESTNENIPLGDSIEPSP